ncbi:MAG: DUF1699 family protein [Candidatus Diapherotrites archaeon]|nr:DUF1699 family protein [Candidatus Diapherotrites archaeon]
MRMIQTSSKQELLRAIEELDENITEVYINARPSMDIVMNIMENAPNIQAIYCPPSLLKQTSTKVFSVLEEKGVKLAHKDVKVGRPKKYSNETVREIIERRRNGQPVKDISKEMNIPLRTVYYYLKNAQ